MSGTDHQGISAMVKAEEGAGAHHPLLVRGGGRHGERRKGPRLAQAWNTIERRGCQALQVGQQWHRLEGHFFARQPEHLQPRHRRRPTVQRLRLIHPVQQFFLRTQLQNIISFLV